MSISNEDKSRKLTETSTISIGYLYQKKRAVKIKSFDK